VAANGLFRAPVDDDMVSFASSDGGQSWSAPAIVTDTPVTPPSRCP
jgi:hypothetical protein